ncbi:MAG: alpha/beta-type small acid-soluble spore protein [Clostridia bacterium]|nr:alpha/beta-type small acid-soluble spore protein [Clostridia bacterium]
MSNSETRKKLNNLKMEAAAEIGMTQFVKENNDHYKGDMPSKLNGAEGGPVGGQMVKKIIRSEQDKMSGGN